MFLTPAELHDLTGYKRASAQLTWLRERGWPVEEDRHGRPRLLRAVLEARMGAVPPPSEAAPNWDALHGS